MSINQELLTFANSRSPWQRDSLRRICTQTDLTPADIQEILANLKAVEGLATAGNLEHLADKHLSSRTATTRTATILTSISDVKHANRLAPNQTLLFAESGITLIYGYNGSGKTGYGRILKQVCRSRHEKQEPILGDVFSTAAAEPASATIGYKSGGTQHAATWKDGTSAPSDLGRISVFDATTAPLYADRQNKIEFLPLGLDVLPRLAKLCDELSASIVAEITTVNAKLLVPLPSVTSSKFVQFAARFGPTVPISQVPTDGEITAEFSWSTSDDGRVLTLEEEIRKVSEPAKLAAQHIRLKRSLETTRTKIGNLLAKFTQKSIKDMHDVFTEARAARAAATLAAAGRFDGDPLGDSPTTDAWRKLYESAEAFNAIAYPGEEFPATGIGRVCLLCQQSLDEVSSDRLIRFRSFLQDTTQQEAIKAERRLEFAITEVASLAVITEADIEQQLSELVAVRESSSSLLVKLKSSCQSISFHKEQVAMLLRGEVALESVTAADASVLDKIDSVAGELDTEIKAFEDQTKDDSALRDLKRQHAELVDRKSCSSNQGIFEGRRADLCTLDALKKCKAHCDTTAISRKGTLLRETYLTEDFRKKIKAEIEYLGLGYLPVVVEGRTDRGVGYIGVALSKTGREPSSRILSEGEFRGLALACFFAEISSIEGHDGIIVDDPVSSLDHLHIEQVAERLIQEAKIRPQVIVFTHDLAFYYDVWVAASEAQIPVHRNWVYRDGAAGFGTIISGDGPWQVKKVRERVAILEGMVNAMPEQAQCAPDEYQKKTEDFYSKLRETWERVVEECLLNDVVGRFQPGVATQSLKGVSVTNDDYRKVFFAMKKASEFSGHDRPAGRQPVARSKNEMKNDLGEVWAYEKELKKRSESLAKERRDLEVPPAAVTSAPTAER
jgi:energy-coupling factor transporter ATP-binding protein EcfA2